MKHPYFRSAFITIGSFLVVATVVGAWTSPEPGTVPPANNVPSPINVGNVFQEKTGGLWVNTLGVTGGGTFGGNVGIGTTDPKNKLHVYGVIGSHNPAGSPNNVAQMFVDGDTGVFNYGHMGGAPSGRLDLRVENVPRLSILQTNGNVGIGTSNPSEKLVVSGVGTQRFLITETSQGVTTKLAAGIPPDTQLATPKGWVGTVTNHPFQVGVAEGADIHISTNRNIGIGNTNPQVKLDVTGKIRSQSTANADAGTTVVTKDYVDAKVGASSVSGTIKGCSQRVGPVLTPGTCGSYGSVQCPAGTAVIGGGVTGLSNASLQNSLQSSNGWYVSVYKGSGNCNANIGSPQVIAMCCTINP